jgi:hypothetical protein
VAYVVTVNLTPLLLDHLVNVVGCEEQLLIAIRHALEVDHELFLVETALETNGCELFLRLLDMFQLVFFFHFQ